MKRKLIKNTKLNEKEIIDALATVSKGSYLMGWKVFEKGMNHFIIQNTVTGDRFYFEGRNYAQYTQV